MRYYRLHIIALLGPIAEGLVLGGLGLGLALIVKQPLLLSLLAIGMATIIWQTIRWYAFSVAIVGSRVLIRGFKGFVVDERLVSLNAPGGVKLRQNVVGWLLDYGTLRIDMFGEPVLIYYLTPFRVLQREIDGR